MKVLIMAHGHPSMHKGGGEVAAYSLHTMLREAGHQSVFVGWGGNLSMTGGSLVRVDEDDYLIYTQSEYFHFSSQSDRLGDSLEILLRNYAPDVVHLHHYMHIGIEIPALVKKLLPGVKVVLTLHEYLAICANNGQLFTKAGDVCAGYRPDRCCKCFPERTAAAFFMREIAIKSAFSFVDWFVSPSRFLADQYALWGIPQDRIKVVENPLPVPEVESDERLDAPGESGVWKLGFFGQINYYKGLDVILDGVGKAIDQGCKVEVGIHGNFTAVNGQEYIDGLKKKISDLGASANYCGPYKQADVTLLMQQYHWVVMGSRWYENSPVVIQEAIACGVPLIVPKHGGMVEKVNSAGLMYIPGSAQSLCKLLTKMTDDTYLEAIDAVDDLRMNMHETTDGNFRKIVSLYEIGSLET